MLLVNKAGLVEAVAEGYGGDKRAAAKAVEQVLSTIVREVATGQRVTVTGFGTFERVTRPARWARNPQTGERVRVPAVDVPRLRPGQGFKDIVSGERSLPLDGESCIKKAPKGSLAAIKAAEAAANKKATSKKKASKASKNNGGKNKKKASGKKAAKK